MAFSGPGRRGDFFNGADLGRKLDKFDLLAAEEEEGGVTPESFFALEALSTAAEMLIRGNGLAIIDFLPHSGIIDLRPFS